MVPLLTGFKTYNALLTFTLDIQAVKWTDTARSTFLIGKPSACVQDKAVRQTHAWCQCAKAMQSELGTMCLEWLCLIYIDVPGPEQTVMHCLIIGIISLK